MNTTALRSPSAFAADRRATTGKVAPSADALRSVPRDVIAGLLSVTKAGLLEQQAPRPRPRRL